MKIGKYLIHRHYLLITFLWPGVLSASNGSDFLKKDRKIQSTGFIENKGQIIDQNNMFFIILQYNSDHPQPN